MKKLLLFSLLVVFSRSLAQVTPVYLNFGSHNEAGGTDPNYATTSNYITYSTLVKKMADTIIAKHAKWNFQSDYKFLQGCILHDPHLASTGGNNLLYWMNQSPYIECDPHCHEGIFNWADIAKLHDSLGMPNRTVVGGIDPYSSRWAQLAAGINGNSFPSYSWQPHILWGFASPGHGFNDETYGIWRPQDSINFTTDAPSNYLHYIGSGCSNVIFNGSTVSGVMDTLRLILNKIANGTAPSSGFYTATIMMNVRDFSNTAITRVSQIIDSIAPYVTSGQVKWATLQEKDSIWTASYGAVASQWGCGQTLSGIDVPQEPLSGLVIYPNPSAADFHIKIYDPIDPQARMELIDVTGKKICDRTISSNEIRLETSEIPQGIYFCKIINGEHSTIRKLVLNKN